MYESIEPTEYPGSIGDSVFVPRLALMENRNLPDHISFNARFTLRYEHQQRVLYRSWINPPKRNLLT